jgi:outer membrane biosynthesis protein TonB
MAEPRRLLDDPDASPLARSLLSSAGDDGPTSDHRAAAAKRLGIAAITLAGGSKAGSAAVATAMWWKAGLLVVLLGGIIGVAVVVSSADLAGSAASDRARLTRVAVPADSTPPPADLVPPAGMSNEPVPVVPADDVAPPPPPVEATPPPPPKRVTKPATASVPESPPEPPPSPEPVTEAPAEPPVTEAPAPPPIRVDARRLAAEVALLDRARGALKRRDTTTALAALDQHRRDFHDGALVAEAEVVRIEALIQAKDHAAARAQAQSFLARFPKSPLVRRVRSLVENLKEAP